MFSWSKYPLLRIFGSYLFGITVAFNLRNYFHIHLFIGIIITISGIIAFVVSHRFISYKNRIITGGIILLLMIWMGFLSTSIVINTKNIPKEIVYSKQKQLFIADVKESPAIKTKSIKVVVNVIQYQEESIRKPVNFDMILYLEKCKNAENINYGDRIVFYVYPQTIASRKNPEEFNYQRYLEIKNIHLQGYVKNDAWIKIGENKGNFIMVFASRLRGKWLQILNKGNLGKDENAIISAILLGADDKLDPELAKEYASAGVSHILSVSGMHVGIIFMIVNYLLFFLSKGKKQKIIKTTILLLVIWLYACITGMCPSVMRASTMFTFVALGNLFERQVNTYNSLLTSLFFLCCINPLIIYEVGTQLSYFAVLGIVWLQKPVKNTYLPKTKVGNYIWEIIAVSLVAQFLTFPLSMYYFHQFPNYFLFANIAVITFTPFIVGAGILCLVFSFWGWAYDYLSIILNYMIKIMNSVVSFIEKLPFSTFQNISINSFQLFLLYILILCFASALLYKKKIYVFVLLICLNLIVGIGLFNKINTIHSHEMLMYSIRKGFVIDFRNGKNVYVVGDSLSLSNVKKNDFYVSNYRIKKGVTKCTLITSDFKDENFLKLGNVVRFFDKDLIIINHRVYYEKNPKEKLKIDYLILDNNPPVKIKNLLKMIEPKTIIFSTNNSKYKIQHWENECRLLKIPCKDLADGFIRIL